MIATPETQGLHVKSYFASSFQEAMKQAQREMGPDALLLNSRETLPEARHLGAWEVVFGASQDPVRQTATSEPMAGGEEVIQHLHDIQALLKRLASSPPGADRGQDSVVSQALMDAGLDR